MKKLLLIFSMVTVLFLVACNSSSDGDANTADNDSGEDAIVIGFSQVTTESPFYTSLVDGAKAKAEELGVKLEVIDAQNNIEKQNADVQSLITKGIDVLLLNPVNPSSVAPALKAAESSNVPIVTVDRATKEEVASYIGRDNKEMGRLAGEQALELLGGENATGKIIEIQGDAGGVVMQDRHDGFHEAISKASGLEVIEGPYSDYIRANAVSAMQDLLQAHPDVKLVYAHNDDMALGALQVLNKAGRNDVLVVGIDGLMEAVKKIAEESEYKATVINDPISLGALAIETAVKIAKGEKVEKVTNAATGLINADNASNLVDDTKTFAEDK